MPRSDSERPVGESFKAENDTQAGLISQFVVFATHEPHLNREELLTAT